jgi:hypothetical protein
LSYRPYSGLLPSISATAANGFLSTSTEAPRSDVSVSTAFTPSAWFRAMQAAESRPTASASSCDAPVPLPGADILVRVAAAQEAQRKANAAKAAAKSLAPLPETYGSNGGNEDDLDADCIQFSREVNDVEAPLTEGGPTAVGNDNEEAPVAKKPRSLEDMTSVYEELGTGRSGRRKAHKEVENKKRNRTD